MKVQVNSRKIPDTPIKSRAKYKTNQEYYYYKPSKGMLKALDAAKYHFHFEENGKKFIKSELEKHPALLKRIATHEMVDYSTFIDLLYSMCDDE